MTEQYQPNQVDMGHQEEPPPPAPTTTTKSSSSLDHQKTTSLHVQPSVSSVNSQLQPATNVAVVGHLPLFYHPHVDQGDPLNFDASPTASTIVIDSMTNGSVVYGYGNGNSPDCGYYEQDGCPDAGPHAPPPHPLAAPFRSPVTCAHGPQTPQVAAAAASSSAGSPAASEAVDFPPFLNHMALAGQHYQLSVSTDVHLSPSPDGELIDSQSSTHIETLASPGHFFSPISGLNQKEKAGGSGGAADSFEHVPSPILTFSHLFDVCVQSRPVDACDD